MCVFIYMLSIFIIKKTLTPNECFQTNMKLHMHTQKHVRTTPRGRGSDFVKVNSISVLECCSISNMGSMCDHQWS